MYLFEIIAERRIQEAMKNGEFDNLPGKGKPLPKDNLDYVPEELRAACKILKNAGYVPEEVELRKAIYHLTDLLRTCTDAEEISDIRKKLNQKQLRYSMLMESRETSSSVNLMYQEMIMERLKD